MGILTFLMGVIAGIILMSMLNAAHTEDMCRECSYAAAIEKITDRKSTKTIAIVSSIATDKYDDLPLHEPIRKKSKRPGHKRRK